MHIMPTPPTIGRVYYATDRCNIKIGHSVSPKRRGGELQVEMLLTFEGTQEVEKRHHRMWAKYRIGTSEWFRPADELLLWLSMSLIDAGKPREARLLRELVFGVKRAVAA